MFFDKAKTAKAMSVLVLVSVALSLIVIFPEGV